MKILLLAMAAGSAGAGARYRRDHAPGGPQSGEVAGPSHQLHLPPEAGAQNDPRQQEGRARGAPRIHHLARNCAATIVELVRFDGKYEDKGQYVTYDKPGHRYKGLDLDGELLDSLADDMMHDKNGKDGIGNDLFPLTYHRQLKYNFKLMKEEMYQGVKVYRVRFEPKQKPKLEDLEDGGRFGKARR